MRLPHLLLVDDSEAVLAFETSVLAGRYEVTTARDGVEAIHQARHRRPDLMVLDLTMPGLAGTDVLATLRMDHALADLPVLVVTSEARREDELRKAGADGFMTKPLQAERFIDEVGRLLAEASERGHQGDSSVLFFQVGPLELGVLLLTVERVLMQPATEPLPGGLPYLSQMFLYQGEPLGVLDLASRLGVAHASPLPNRKLILFERSLLPFAVQVDEVQDPEDFRADEVRSPAQLGLDGSGALGELLTAVVRTDRGTRPLIDPRSLVSKSALRQLPSLLGDLAGRWPEPPRLPPFPSREPA